MSPYVCWVCWDIEQQSRHSEPGKNIQKILLEAQHNASYKETLYFIPGCGSRPQGVSKCKLKLIRESMLWEWFHPELKMVWSESKIFSMLNGLKLIPE